MAFLYVTEFASIGGISNFPIQSAQTPALAEQRVAISGSHHESAAFDTNTKFVRLNTDAICSVAFGTSATAATTSDARMAANQTEYFSVLPGQLVSVIANT